MSDTNQQQIRFLRLLRLRQQALLQIEQKLAQRLQQLRVEQASMNQMNQELDQVLDSSVASDHADHLTAWEAKSRYAENLRHQLQRQQAVVEEVREGWQALQRKYGELRAEAKSLELVLEKHAQQLRKHTLQHQQMRLDDMMLSRRHADHVESGW